MRHFIKQQIGEKSAGSWYINIIYVWLIKVGK